jgi:hypothetical protein
LQRSISLRPISNWNEELTEREEQARSEAQVLGSQVYELETKAKRLEGRVDELEANEARDRGKVQERS